MVGIIFKKKFTMQIEEILQHDALIEQKQMVDLVGGDWDNTLLSNHNKMKGCKCFGNGDNTNDADDCLCSNFPPTLVNG